MKRVKVVKFGGTSLADANQIRKVIDIVQSDSRRRYVVVSAPGKRTRDDQKITDLLYGLRNGIDGLSRENILDIIEDRFHTLLAELDLKCDLVPYLKTLRYPTEGNTVDFLASRGEYLSARILAECDSRFMATTSSPSRSASWSISFIWLSMLSTCRSSLSVLLRA